ncbi:hypothetical protein [Kurthia sibirica]|uniref:SbsA Ig-like domain-containing protein n=2 Tax=Kurthia sibirica TaxID=202750 RepID=A0A2U3AMN4_9BACL|nr:hypothetical protein [Kurthia sibirica]PWI25769.1 hypothetical protein DEX24_06090 [Kurthia sibirica]
MSFKLVKTAAAIALGASLVATTVIPGATDASAASKYKIKSGKLVVAKTGKVAKGFVTYNKLVYKDGKKLTGLKGKTYYKAGAKATGTYKGKYYSKGVYKVATGTYNKAYYVKGVKKVTTGLYGAKYYKDGKLATGTYKATYYVNGVKKVTTGYYNKAYYVAGKKVVGTGTYKGAYYVAGKKVVTTGTYEEAYYVDGVKVVETGLYKEELYIKGALNKGLALFEGKLYDDAEFNKGIKEFEEKFYNNEVIADGTFDVAGKEEAFEKGLKVGAKVASVEAINESTIEVKFNKAVSVEAEAVDAATKESTVATVDGATLTEPKLSADGRTLTLTYALNTGVTELKDATATVNPVVTKADAKVSTPKFVKIVNFKDEVAPTIKEVKTVTTGAETVDATISFSEKLKSVGAVSVDGMVKAVSLTTDNTIVIKDIKAGSTVKVVINNLEDLSGNKTATAETTIVTAEDKVAPTASFITDGTNVKVKFSEVIKTGATVTANGTSLTLGTIAEDGFYTIDASSILVTPLLFLKDVKFVVTDVEDLAGNKQEKAFEYTTTIQKADAVVAKLVSAKVAEDGKTITVTYDNKVAVPTTLPTFGFDHRTTDDILNKNQTVTATKGDLSQDEKSITYTLPTALNSGTYNFTLGEDKFNAVVTIAAEEVKPEAKITYTATVKENVITVAFASVVDGLDASAKLASNYKLAGEALPAGTTLEFVGNKNTVEITLPKETIATTGKRTLTAENIKDVKGNTISTAQTVVTVELTDNVASTSNGVATVSSTTQASVKFSEALVTPADFDGVTVKVGGIVLATADRDLTIDATGQLVITNKSVAGFKLNDQVTIELAKESKLADAAGNLAIIK